MIDLANNEERPVWKTFARSVGQIDRALAAVAKTELLGKPHSRVANGNDPAGAPDFIDDIATIMRLDLLLHSGHHVRRAQIDLLACRCAAGDEIRAHKNVAIRRELYSCSNSPLG